jgi:hypothetical protein
MSLVTATDETPCDSCLAQIHLGSTDLRQNGLAVQFCGFKHFLYFHCHAVWLTAFDLLAFRFYILYSTLCLRKSDFIRGYAGSADHTGHVECKAWRSNTIC